MVFLTIFLGPNSFANLVNRNPWPTVSNVSSVTSPTLWPNLLNNIFNKFNFLLIIYYTLFVSAYLCRTKITVLFEILVPSIMPDFSSPSYTIPKPSIAPVAMSNTLVIFLEASSLSMLVTPVKILVPPLCTCGARIFPTTHEAIPIFPAK